MNSAAAERGDGGNRTHDGGFADLCLTTWLRRRLNLRLHLTALLPDLPYASFMLQDPSRWVR
jgi:hypothetical protein